MKLVSFRKVPYGGVHVGAVLNEHSILDLTDAGGSAAFGSMQALIQAGAPALDHARKIVASADSIFLLSPEEVELLAPIPVPVQFRDFMSFHKHIEQSQTAALRMRLGQTTDSAQRAAIKQMISDYRIPDIYSRQPVYYKGNRFGVGHPGSDVKWPAYSKLMDFELELACVIGVTGCDISREDARKHIFGYMIFNDFSARDAQLHEMEGRLGPAKGKDFNGANVFGPYLVTADEVPDPYNLEMRAWVNGELLCDASSSTMHWNFEDSIAHVSQSETLHAGEVLASGTVGGGCGLEHGRFLKDGDVVELEIEGLGRLRNRVVV
ncbi:fumarylacetoacetate hydrolase family protein [Hyphomonas oceanitis]|uniref:Fumarylacetoacetate (FAA) hydrolase n=1 Tax=Hyphomonas oceanitis SCH89 TaxID=1280953 RepID=A0A059G4X6_9PROT|nr:fumarylacetoacetate hydrolase family protein [Hyphomonas oceanitis]KDA01856.1 fumarylacetoacetate (FAA) hydrolase [Hyphomonas oceanitis SCH89]